MDGLIASLSGMAVQCWGCPTFDSLFQIVSGAAAALYGKLATIALILLVVFLVFYSVWAVWKNLQDGAKEPLVKKYFQPVLINSVVAVVLLSMGVILPRTVTMITLEPVAEMTKIVSVEMQGTTLESVDANVPYEFKDMTPDGFFRPQLRDKLIDVVRVSVHQLQGMVRLGMYVMDGAFSWNALLGIGSFVKHLVMFFFGLGLTFYFFKFFIKFCFYFVDVIINLTFFAFFFPFTIVTNVFSTSQAAGWAKGYGSKLAGYLKKSIDSIVSLGAAVIIYAVIAVLIARFFANNEIASADLARAAMNGELYSGDLSDDNLAALSLGSLLIMTYVIDFIFKQIPQISNTILKAFNIDRDEFKQGETAAKDAEAIGKNILGAVKTGFNKLTGKEGAPETGTAK